MVCIICLVSGGLLNAAISPVRGKGTGEQAILQSPLDTLNPGDSLLGNVYYGVYFLLTELMVRDVDAVFEQYGARKRSVDFDKGKQLGNKVISWFIKSPNKGLAG